MQPPFRYTSNQQSFDDEKSDGSEVIEESVYSDDLPGFTVEMLDKLYGSLYCTLPAIALMAQGSCPGVTTYVHRQAHGLRLLPDTVLMFRQNEHAVQVINEGMQLSGESIERFCEYLFAKQTKTTQINFHAIAKSAMTSSRPSLWWSCTEDIVVTLPDSTDTYWTRLGKSTRKSMKKSLSRAQRELAGFFYCVKERSAIDEGSIRQIVDFNHARMAQKGRQSALDESAVIQLIGMMHSHGYAGLMMSGKRVCAGTLTCRFGDDVFSLVNAHDPTFDQLRLGNLSRHLMVLSAIDAGAQRFHLLGGNLSGKQAALGKRQRLYHLTVYRTRAVVVSDLTGIARRTASACVYRMRSWLEDRQADRSDGWLGCVVTLLVYLWRRWRRGLPASARPARGISAASGLRR